MSAEIESKVNDLLMDMLGLDKKPKLTDKLGDDLGADSLDAVEIIMECEVKFNIRIPDEEAENILTVQDMVNVVTGKLAEEA